MQMQRNRSRKHGRRPTRSSSEGLLHRNVPAFDTEQEHLLLLDELFMLLIEEGLKLNPKNLQLIKREVTFLKSVISEGEWNEVLRPVAYTSRLMSAVEIASCTRCLLAVHWALQHFTHVTGFCKVIIHTPHTPIQLLLNGHVTGVHKKPGVSELADGNRRADTAAKAAEREGQRGVSLWSDSVSSMKQNEDTDSEGWPTLHLRPAEGDPPPPDLTYLNSMPVDENPTETSLRCLVMMRLLKLFHKPFVFFPLSCMFSRLHCSIVPLPLQKY
ncbi:hypothetical protein AOLI_G00218060 [Acnodon oligacanthus]